MADYIPSADDQFQSWFNTFANWCNTNGTTHGLTAGEVTALNDTYSDWNAEWTANGLAQAAALAATQSKDTARTTAEPGLRAAAAKIQAHAATTNADRAAAGLTVRSDTRTPPPCPPPGPSR